MAQFIMSIDQGTTGSTVTLMNSKGQQKVKVNREFRQIFPKPGWVEHNPNDIWRSVITSMKEALQKSKVKAKDIAAIGITNQRETVMAWDRRNGKPVGNAIVWQCRRTTEFCQKLKRRRGVEAMVKKDSGLVIDPYFSGTKMHWILNNNNQAKKLAKQGFLCFGTVDAFLVWNLTNGDTFATDVSNASRTMCMDLQKIAYNQNLMKLFGVNEDMLPDIRPSAGLFGYTKKVTGLPDGIPIAGVIGDQQSALFGQTCFNKGDAKITYGTGSFLLMNTGTSKVLSKKGLLTTVAWQLPDQKKVTYALEGGAFICGAAVQWMRDNMQFFKSSSEIENLAKKVDDAGGVQFVPAFAGLGAPYWDPEVRGTITGITRGTTREHLARATLEGMALQNVDIVNTMKKEARASMKFVRVDGGAAADDLLMQMQADFLGVDVIRPKVIETTAVGAGLMAGLGVGLWASVDELKGLDQVDKVFKPKWNRTMRSNRVGEWHKAIEGIQQVY